MVDGHNRFAHGTFIHPPDPNAFLFTDASHYGWGAHLESMRLSFHGYWTKDQSQLHINILEIKTIRFALKEAIQYIHYCVMISTDNTTMVSCINKQGETHYPNLCIEVWEILHWCLEHDIILRICHIPGKFNILADRLSRLYTCQYRMVPGSNGGKLHLSNAQIFQCGFVCDSIQSQTPIVCISSSRQSSHCNRCIINELEQFTCLCISTNNSDTIYSKQNPSISVQNSSNCSSLASMSLVLRGVTATSLNPDSTSLFSKLTNTSKRKVSTSKPPNSCTSGLRVIKQSEIKYFRKTLQILSQNQEKHLLRKSMMQNG